MPPLIALSGKKFSGKSTLAREIAAVYDVPIVNFAGPLKAGCQALGVEIDGPNKDVKTLQDIGVYFRENKGYDWWVQVLDRNTPDRETTGLVVDDLRFPNEFDWCDDNGLLLVRIEVSRETQIQRALAMGMTQQQIDEIDFEHASETGLDDTVGWHLTFMEESTVEERMQILGLELTGAFFI